MQIATIEQTSKRIKEKDERSAINSNMLRTLAEDKSVYSFKRGNRTEFETGRLMQDLNSLFGFKEKDKLPRVRSIHNAYIEIKDTNPELGISEERIRFLVMKEKLPCIRIGNRAYVALETFEAPYDHCLIYDDYIDSRDAIIEQKAREQFERAIARR